MMSEIKKTRVDEERSLTMTPSGAVKAAGKRTPSRRTSKKEGQEPVSSMTPQVMKLVMPHDDYINPIIVAGKRNVPKNLRGMDSLSHILRKNEEPEVPDEEITVNLTHSVINENAVEILRRFNACVCEKCIAALTAKTEEKIPARFVKVSKKAVQTNSEEYQKLKEPLKKTATAQMIRVMMMNKKRSFHEG